MLLSPLSLRVALKEALREEAVSNIFAVAANVTAPVLESTYTSPLATPPVSAPITTSKVLAAVPLAA